MKKMRKIRGKFEIYEVNMSKIWEKWGKYKENMRKNWGKWGKFEEKYDKTIFQECNPECSDFQQECQKEGNV